MTTMDLPLARILVAGVLREAEARDLKPLAVAVLDAGGHVVAFERTDGASNGRFAIAHGKAHGAVAMGLGSRALMVRAETQAYFVTAVSSALGGALVPVPGGVLIRDADGTLVGAVGVTGDTSDNDEACAVVAIEAAALVADTG